MKVSHRLDDLKLHESLQSLVDSILDLMEKCRQFAMLDEVSVKALEKSMPDEGNESHCDEDHFLYTQHEAGHFLVGYLLGVLPRGYEIPSKEALRQDRFAAGRVEFVGFEFLRQVRTTEIVEKKFSKGKVCDRMKLFCFYIHLIHGKVAIYKHHFCIIHFLESYALLLSYISFFSRCCEIAIHLTARTEPSVNQFVLFTSSS